MKEENLNKLVNLLQLAVTQNHKIILDQYQSSYLEVFLDQISENPKEIHSDTFSDELVSRLRKGGLSSENVDKFVGEFSVIWNAWVSLYRKLEKKGLISLK